MMPPYSMPASMDPPPEEGFTANAGSPLTNGAEPVGEDAVVEALRSVHDPEIPVNIYDLGLIYEVEPRGRGDWDIVMTLTAPACPVAGELPGQVAEAVAAVDGVGEVAVTLTWDPPWTPANMSEVAKVELDMY
ncbi:iron-sulfur cluster assembly protein [Roseospira visakhapatnamensis]|uniref:FeS assembly SUF system protein n=1 Tax=Roseospira visakhapatnamensis TaxID=390880 RepID=A0A7W6W906_9PROT|nr:iron-sulfur cluster assembly protein [Roseospira visakhapatnamensis]MBB4265353.1 FeS assembly SUF system protein [Roseospira visakhapatnamensis]